LGRWIAEREAVCAGDRLGDDAVSEVLGRLVSKSLAVAELPELSVNYRFLENVLAYAPGQLSEAGEAASSTTRSALISGSEPSRIRGLRVDCPTTTVPRPGRAETSPSARSTASARLAVATATPQSRVIARAEGIG
jgi:hypothetical protein